MDKDRLTPVFLKVTPQGTPMVQKKGGVLREQVSCVIKMGGLVCPARDQQQRRDDMPQFHLLNMGHVTFLFPAMPEPQSRSKDLKKNSPVFCVIWG